jgi:hypothetical protein
LNPKAAGFRNRLSCRPSPSRAKHILDWAPGNLAAMDESHADDLVDAGAVDPKKLVVPLLRRAA